MIFDKNKGTKRVLVFCCITLLIASLLSGCGFLGDRFLPEKTSSEETQLPDSSEESASESNTEAIVQSSDESTADENRSADSIDNETAATDETDTPSDSDSPDNAADSPESSDSESSPGIDFQPEEIVIPDGTPNTDDTEVSAENDYMKTDVFGNQFVNIPDGTLVLTYNGDPQQTFDEMADALAARYTSVCVINPPSWYDTTDFYAMPYSSFWLYDVSGSGIIGQTSRDDEPATYHFYRFLYYDLSDEELAEMKAQIDSASWDIISLIPEDADDWTKARIVHDELCRLVTYDDSAEAPHCHDTYGALVNHLAVCTGYACAFSHILSLLGNFSPLSYSNEHAWNYVSVPSDQVYIDVTWDDPDMTDAYGDPYIDYSYFFLTREEVESIDSHSISSMDPVSEAYDPAPYNYYAHEGYLLYDYDWGTILDTLYRQYVTGTNLLTLRFYNEEDYLRAVSWKENDGAELQDFLSALGYYGTYYYWYNDVMQTVSFGLYASES